MEVGKPIEKFQEESFELYNPKSDPGESENPAASQAETAEQLRTVLFDCQSVTNVRRPPENPEQAIRKVQAMPVLLSVHRRAFRIHWL